MRLKLIGALGGLLLLALGLMPTAARAELPNDAGERLVVGERLKIGLVGDVVDGESVWLERRILQDGAIYLPTGVKVVVVGLPRGQVEQTLAARYGAEFVIISRLDHGEDHGRGQVPSFIVISGAPEPLPDSPVRPLGVPLEFDRVSAEEVIDYLANLTNSSIVVDWDALAREGIDAEAEISTQNPVGAPANRALQSTLEQLGTDQVKLGYDVRGGVVTVATRDALDARQQRMVVDARPWLRRASRDGLKIGDEAGRRAAVEALIQAINNAITSGERGSDAAAQVSELDGRLVITASLYELRDVLRLLDDLGGVARISQAQPADADSSSR